MPARPPPSPRSTLCARRQVDAGLEVAQRYLASSPSGVAKSTLTESFLRRLQKLTDDDLFASEDF